MFANKEYAIECLTLTKIKVNCGQYYDYFRFMLRFLIKHLDKINLNIGKEKAMAKPTTIKIKLLSTADTGFFYVTKKNARTMTEKMVKRKYDPVVRKHVDFKETKIK